MTQYIRVTDELPPKDEEVWVFNGETEFKNIHDGNDWKYQLKYPPTHWMQKPPRPTMEDVLRVREQMIY